MYTISEFLARFFLVIDAWVYSSPMLPISQRGQNLDNYAQGEFSLMGFGPVLLGLLDQVVQIHVFLFSIELRAASTHARCRPPTHYIGSSPMKATLPTMFAPQYSIAVSLLI